MIISGQQIQEILRLYGVSQAKSAEQRSVNKSVNKNEHLANTGESDRAELSQEALVYRKAREAALNAPDIREERVRQIKEAIANGEYNVSSEDIAEKMLGRFYVDYLA